MILRVGLPPCRVDRDAVPPLFPTHRHPADFWEALGRAVAAYGHLEEVLARAFFAISGTQSIGNEDQEILFQKWLKDLDLIVSDQLGNLIDKLEKLAVADDRFDRIEFQPIINNLRKAAQIRNALCHGSWPPPDLKGSSKPLFVDRKGNLFDTSIDISFLEKVRVEVAELSFDVRDLVTILGIQFPGTNVTPEFGKS